MPNLFTNPAVIFSTVTAAGSICVCFIAWLMSLELRVATQGQGGASWPAGFAAGVGAWATPLLWGAWPAGFGFCPVMISTAFLVAIPLIAVGFAVERRFDDARGIIGGGAFLGAGLALSQGLIVLGLRSEGPLGLDGMPVAAAIAFTSPLAVSALWLQRQLPGIPGRLGAALVLAVAGTISHLVARGAIDLTPDAYSALCDGHRFLPAETMTPLAGAMLTIVLLSVRRFADPASQARHQGDGRDLKFAAFSTALANLNKVPSSSARPMS
jgi:NO-binding membrane sensor protein with MHYT domain